MTHTLKRKTWAWRDYQKAEDFLRWMKKAHPGSHPEMFEHGSICGVEWENRG